MALVLATSTIVAQAVRELEQSPVSSFGDDHRFPQALADAYPTALDACLEDHDWSFARVLADLPAADPDPAPAADPDLPYLYQLPSDCVKLRHVYLDLSTSTWRRDGDFLRSDQATSLKIRYTRRDEQESLLPATFREAVSLRLAVMLAPEWLTTRTKRADLYNMADRALTVAKKADRVDGTPRRWDGDGDTVDWISEAQK